MIVMALKIVGAILGVGALVVLVAALYFVWCMANDPHFFR